MRVHHIINTISDRSGGAERLARQLHLSLLERGVDTRLVGLSGPPPATLLPAATNLCLRSPYTPRSLPGLARHLAGTVKPGDIVHGHLFPTIAYLVALRRIGLLKDVRLVFTEHNTSNRRRQLRVGALIDRNIYRHIDVIVAISQGVADALCAWMPMVRERTVVIHNGVALDCRKRTIRAATSRPLVVSLGNLRYTKNYGTALKAVALLRDLDFQYAIAGEGPDRAALSAQIEALQLTGKVTLLGYVDDPHALLQQADIFLMPSIIEGFGLAAVEAMNASLPVIAGDVAGLSEVVGATGGILVSPTDPGKIAASLRTLVTSAERRDELGQAAFERSLGFAHDVMVERYLALYRSLA